ncbi:MAG: glucose-1-phosphate thymidylyltransferase [Rhodothermaceae bacterium]|nr:MAG: glucose-1-phosphate thymidylyltransferase [Rhodothermaceae bacterium]
MKLIIPMAGRGTRVRPHSHVTPKPLLPVKGKSMVERIVDTFNQVLPRALDAGVFVLGPDFGDEVRAQLADICRRHGMEAHFAVQEQALGTAHAVYAAAPHLDGEGIVVFADTLFYMEPVEHLEDADVVAWVKWVEDPRRFGVAVREGDCIKALVEKPKEPISHEALIGIYYVKDLAVLRDAIAELINLDIKGHGEYQLTDALDRMLQAGRVFKTATVTDWLDCGTIPALLETTKVILDRERDDLHQGTIEDSVVIDPVYVGPGAVVRNAVVGPNVSIEAGARVVHAVLRESIVFGEAHVEGAVLTDTLVGRHAVVREAPRVLNIGDHSEVGSRG